LHALQELITAHPLLFPDYTLLVRVTPAFSPVQRRDEPYRDPWGYVWYTSEDGITGTVTEHPLADWAAFEDYRAPDPDRTDGLGPIDWAQVARDIQDHNDQAARKINAEDLHKSCPQTIIACRGLRRARIRWHTHE
jgi:hypothetical protein